MVILSGGFVLLGSSFASHDVVVPAYVQTLTNSSWMVGLTGALLRMGWVFPQIFVSRWIEPRERKKPIYLFAQGARGGLWLAIGLSTFLLQGGDLWMPDIKITSFLTLYCLTTTAIRYCQRSDAGRDREGDSIAYPGAVDRLQAASGEFAGRTGGRPGFVHPQ